MHDHYQHPHPHSCEDLRLEAVTVSVGFDDLLEVSLQMNLPHLDTMIVVTSHDDNKTHKLCKKYGAFCVQTDLFRKNKRQFNKGAAINIGFGYWQYHGWRMYLDSDIVLPDNFRRVIFNHTNLQKSKLYGADRINVVGKANIDKIRKNGITPQFTNRCFVESGHAEKIGGRFVSMLHGYLPLGYFQLWNAKTQKAYPYSLGSCEHDDTLFSALWPENQRELLPSTLVYHLCPRAPKWSENWEGRKSPRLDK
jgi:hypothetical protein